MAAAVESLDSFRTPNLFEASIAADSYFSDKMDVDRNDYFAASDDWIVFPQAQEAETSNDMFSSMGGDGFVYSTMQTPPPSAKEAPADWNFTALKADQQQFANPLHQIDTSQTVNARFDWGQPTPPDDQASSDSQFPLAAAEEAIKVEPDVEQSKPAPPPPPPQRRKKSEDSADGISKRRRSRKSMSAGSIASVPSADPVEEERRNRFLERNRVAASKCRQKKKEWTQNLESHARDLHSNNHQLQVLVGSLKDEVMYLRGEMLKHGSCDCSGIRDYLSREADFLASGGTRTPGSQASGMRSSRHGSAALGSPRSTSSIATATTAATTQKGRHSLDSQLQGLGKKTISERSDSVCSDTASET